VDTIDCGSASGLLRVGNDGIGTATFSGLLVPANFLALGVLTMRAGVGRNATGLLYRNDQAAICCDPVSMTASYPNLAPALRALPVAFVVNTRQAAGLLRKAFFSETEAREWLDQSMQMLADNRAWWAGRR
jgi:hypothetical protein